MTNKNKTGLHIQFPRRNEELKLSGRQIEARSETLIPITDESGNAAWFWFPGRSYGATAHWWVHDAETRLIGDVVRVRDRYAQYLHDEYFFSANFFSVVVDANRNSTLVPPHQL